MSVKQLIPSIKGNVCLGVERDISQDEIAQVCQLANTAQFIEQFPEVDFLAIIVQLALCLGIRYNCF